MKKFITDNIVWFVLAAIILSGFAIYKLQKDNKPAETPAETPTTPATE